MDRTQRNQAPPTDAGGRTDPPAAPGSQAICSPPRPCRLAGTQLVVAPFRIMRHGQTYHSPREIRIDLESVAPATYQVVAVHNFHIEDCNPCLNECIAGVFLASRRDDGRWEAPERFPIECRAVGVLAELRVADDGRALALAP